MTIDQMRSSAGAEKHHPIGALEKLTLIGGPIDGIPRLDLAGVGFLQPLSNEVAPGGVLVGSKSVGGLVGDETKNLLLLGLNRRQGSQSKSQKQGA